MPAFTYLPGTEYQMPIYARQLPRQHKDYINHDQSDPEKLSPIYRSIQHHVISENRCLFIGCGVR